VRVFSCSRLQTSPGTIFLPPLFSWARQLEKTPAVRIRCGCLLQLLAAGFFSPLFPVLVSEPSTSPLLPGLSSRFSSLLILSPPSPRFLLPSINFPFLASFYRSSTFFMTYDAFGAAYAPCLSFFSPHGLLAFESLNMTLRPFLRHSAQVSPQPFWDLFSFSRRAGPRHARP